MYYLCTHSTGFLMLSYILVHTVATLVPLRMCVHERMKYVPYAYRLTFSRTKLNAYFKVFKTLVETTSTKIS